MSFLDRLRGKSAPPPPEFGDLTPLIAHARKGLRREVAKMTAAWRETGLFLPLAKAIPGVPDDSVVKAKTELTLHSHCIFDPSGSRFAAAFSRDTWLADFGARGNWRTDGGALRHVQLPTPAALQFLSAPGTSLAGVVINPGRPEELLLLTDEIAEMLPDRAIPLERYCPPRAEAGEPVMAGQPSVPPPPEMLRRLAELVAEEPMLASHDLRQHYMPERHRRPHLLIELRLASRGTPEETRAQIAHRLGQNLSGLVPHGDFIEITFTDPPPA